MLFFSAPFFQWKVLFSSLWRPELSKVIFKVLSCNCRAVTWNSELDFKEYTWSSAAPQCCSVLLQRTHQQTQYSTSNKDENPWHIQKLALVSLWHCSFRFLPGCGIVNNEIFSIFKWTEAALCKTGWLYFGTWNSSTELRSNFLKVEQHFCHYHINSF